MCTERESRIRERLRMFEERPDLRPPWLSSFGDLSREDFCLTTIAQLVPSNDGGGADLDRLEQSLFSREERGMWLVSPDLHLVFERHGPSAISTEPSLRTATLRTEVMVDSTARWAVHSEGRQTNLVPLHSRARQFRDRHGWHCGDGHLRPFVSSCSLDVLLLVVLAEQFSGIDWILTQPYPKPNSENWHVWLDQKMCAEHGGPLNGNATRLQETLAVHSVIVELLEWAWRVGRPLEALRRPDPVCLAVAPATGDTFSASAMEWLFSAPSQWCPGAVVLPSTLPAGEETLILAREILLAKGLIDRDARVYTRYVDRRPQETRVEMLVEGLGCVRWLLPYQVELAAAGIRLQFAGQAWW